MCRKKIEEKRACKQCHEQKVPPAPCPRLPPACGDHVSSPLCVQSRQLVVDDGKVSDEWEPQPTPSGSVFFRHKVTGETRWVAPGAGAVAGESEHNSVGSGQGMPNAAPG